MPQILRTTLVPDQVISAIAGTDSWDLPPNPLSAILITIKALNNTVTLTDYSVVAAFFNKFSKFDVKYRGASIIEGNSLDLAVAMAMRKGWEPKQGQINNTDNEVRSITFPLLLGKKYGDPRQCFPATRAGDLVLSSDWLADPTGMDNFVLQIETAEILDASPESFLKITQSARTMTAGIGNNLDLPIGNKLLGVLLRAATFPTGASYNSSFGQMAVKVDNVEAYYSETNWETVQGEMGRHLHQSWVIPQHTHQENLAAAYTQNATTLGGRDDSANIQQYGYLDFDPMGDYSMGLDTAGAASVRIANNSDVADVVDSYWYPIEYVKVAGATPAA